MLSVPPPNGGGAGLVEMEIVVVEVIFCLAMWVAQERVGIVQDGLRDGAGGDEGGSGPEESAACRWWQRSGWGKRF